jgi:hypothetical protein
MNPLPPHRKPHGNLARSQSRIASSRLAVQRSMASDRHLSLETWPKRGPVGTQLGLDKHNGLR